MLRIMRKGEIRTIRRDKKLFISSSLEMIPEG